MAASRRDESDRRHLAILRALKRTLRRVRATLQRAGAAHDKADQLVTESLALRADAVVQRARNRELRSLLWKTHDGTVECTYAPLSEAGHEVTITVFGADAWSASYHTAAAATAQAERLRQLFCE